MNISDLLTATRKPPVYTPGTAVMWTDPHISAQLLDIHLSQETDLASRKTPAIDAGLAFILDQAPMSSGLNRNLDILDLGCGPGLYAERLAALGHRVTGMDISAASITHARESARKQKLDITYICQDYLSLDHREEYDLIMMIFTDFGVLFPDQQTELLDRICRALKPGGTFIFDVLNTQWSPDPAPQKAWDISQDGFWRPGPCLTLSETFAYDTGSPGLGLFLSQHTVLDDGRGMEIYRFYTHTFSHDTLKKIMTGHGFKDISCTCSILPDSESYRSCEVSFCRAVR